jgi:hypothetical protein
VLLDAIISVWKNGTPGARDNAHPDPTSPDPNPHALYQYLVLAMRLRPSIVLGRADSDGSFSLQYLLTRSPVKILAGFSIFYLFLIQYCRHANYRDPTSYFFDPTRAYGRMYSADRIREADAFIQSAELLSAGPKPSQQPPAMCVGVATVTRRGEQYVRRTIGSLLDGLSEDERHSLYLNVLIGHTDPSKHPISYDKWVKTLPNKVLEYNKTDFARIQKWEEGGWYRNKTIFDYTYLLNDCYATGARYIAMFEDDTLAVEGWYPRALEALRDVEMKMEHRREKWVFLRLFYIEDLFGWNSEYWPTYLFWSFVTWAIVTSSLVVARNRSRSLQNFLSNASILVISGVCVPALVALFFASGRNSIWPLTPGIHEMNKTRMGGSDGRERQRYYNTLEQQARKDMGLTKQQEIFGILGLNCIRNRI